MSKAKEISKAVEAAATSNAAGTSSGNSAEEKEKEHKFWATQPVIQPEEVKQLKRANPDEVKVGEIDRPKTVADVSTEETPIASVLEWFVLDIDDEKQHEELYQLLRENYVEDSEGNFRFEYPKAFLKWALTPPGFFKEWHIGVRKKDTKEIYGFISGVPAHIRMGCDAVAAVQAAAAATATPAPAPASGEGAAAEATGGTSPAAPAAAAAAAAAAAVVSQKAAEKLICEINFLCVSKKLRDKRMAPILIKEVTRRVNLKNIWQAVYTAGREVPTPLATTQYFHRALNPEKLIDIKFSRMPPTMKSMSDPMGSLKKSLKLDDKRLSHMRPMKETDLPAVLELLKKQTRNAILAPAFDLAEMKHWFITDPAQNLVHAYVREDPRVKEGERVVTDFVSFYALTSSVLNHPKYHTLHAAYAYYYGCTTATPQQLFNEALWYAQEKGFDVFNCLNMLENEKFFNELKFNPGDGKLRYYLYNWRLKPGEAKDIGLVLM